MNRFIYHACKINLRKPTRAKWLLLSLAILFVYGYVRIIAYNEHIHIMQIIIGDQCVRYHVTFMKSLLLHRNRNRNPTTIHLHVITDKATRIILETLLLTWQLPEVRIIFYEAETFQKKISWMHSSHHATKVSTMKMYIPEVINSTTDKLLYFDTDIIIMSDVIDLWHILYKFNQHQILGLAREPASISYNVKMIPVELSNVGYNAGVLLWNLKNLSVSKWEAIWKPVFTRATKLGAHFTAAEQTLLNFMIFEKPTILYELPCYWHIQLYDSCEPARCNTTWNSKVEEGAPAPHLLHIDGPKKREDVFNLVPIPKPLTTIDEFVHNFLVERSRIIQMNGYRFQRKRNTFNFKEILLRIHPEDSKVNANLMKPYWPYFGNFPLHHRIHPAYFCRNYTQLTGDSTGITLVHALHYNKHAFKQLLELTTSWPAPLSVVVHATDLEAHELLGQVLNSKQLAGSNNIAIHIMYKNDEIAPSFSAMHNMAIVFSQTNVILKAKVTTPAYVSALFDVVSNTTFSKTRFQEVKIILELNASQNLHLELPKNRCANKMSRFCVLTIEQNENFHFTTSLQRAVVGILLPRSYGLLPDMKSILSENDAIIALFKNYISPNPIFP